MTSKIIADRQTRESLPSKDAHRLRSRLSLFRRCENLETGGDTGEGGVGDGLETLCVFTSTTDIGLTQGRWRSMEMKNQTYYEKIKKG